MHCKSSNRPERLGESVIRLRQARQSQTHGACSAARPQPSSRALGLSNQHNRFVKKSIL